MLLNCFNNIKNKLKVYRLIHKNFNKTKRKDNSLCWPLRSLNSKKVHKNRDYSKSKDKGKEKPKNRPIKRHCRPNCPNLNE